MSLPHSLAAVAGLLMAAWAFGGEQRYGLPRPVWCGRRVRDLDQAAQERVSGWIFGFFTKN